MQRCSFSETQFVFQYVFEHYNKHRFSPFPFFPDTVAEGKYYGFDICIGNWFFQFKVANQYDASDAKSKSTTQLWNAFKADNYQIIIKASENQYKLLEKLSMKPLYTNSVFYVTPCFHTRRDLISCYNSKTIITNTAHFRVSDFPKSLKGQHKLVYTASSPIGKLFSEPSQIQLSKNILQDGLIPYQQTLSLIDVAFSIRDAIAETNENLTEQIGFPDNELPQNFIKRVQAVLLNEFDVHWFPLIDLNKNANYV
jgi:hypothetical protein